MLPTTKACPKCCQIKPFAAFREPCTPAERRRYDKNFMTRTLCEACRPPRKEHPRRIGYADKGGPVALQKALSNRDLPAPVIEHRVAVRASIVKAKQVKAARAALARKHQVQTDLCLAELDAEVARCRYRESLALQSGDLAGAQVLRDYRVAARELRRQMKLRGTEGFAPPDPWFSLWPPEDIAKMRSKFMRDALEIPWVPAWWDAK